MRFYSEKRSPFIVIARVGVGRRRGEEKVLATWSKTQVPCSLDVTFRCSTAYHVSGM